jgi:hypothetical protein
MNVKEIDKILSKLDKDIELCEQDVNKAKIENRDLYDLFSYHLKELKEYKNDLLKKKDEII